MSLGKTEDVLYDLSGDTPPSAFLQWKGTDVCLDFHCECGWGGHFDGFFAYVIRCGGCERLWQMPTTVPLRPDRRDGESCIVDPISHEELWGS